MGITVDQVRRLCEEGKLKGCKSGEEWDIDPVSLEYYRVTLNDKKREPRKDK